MTLPWAAQSAHMLRTCIRTFGFGFTYQRGRKKHSVQGIWDESYEAVAMTDVGPELQSCGPCLSIIAADLPWPPAKGDKVIHQDKRRFHVHRSEPDSEGAIRLYLHLEAKA